MVLTTSRLLLTPLSEQHFKDIHELCSFPEVAKYNTIGIPVDISATNKRLTAQLENDRLHIWVITDIVTGVFVGEMGITLAPERFKKAEIYYNLHPNQWGKGYARETVKMIINYCFSELKLHRIAAGVAVENENSIRLLEAVGMQREGTCRKILPLQTGWMDNYEYAILEEDPRDY